jgi:hypothetical protein
VDINIDMPQQQPMLFPGDEQIYPSSDFPHPLDSIPEDIREKLGVHRFSDFAYNDMDTLHGAVVSIRQVLGYPIIVTSYKVLPSRFPKKDMDGEIDENATYVKIQFTFMKDPNQVVRVTNTSSGVIQKQLEKFKEEIPFATVIQARKNYLTFT